MSKKSLLEQQVRRIREQGFDRLKQALRFSHVESFSRDRLEPSQSSTPASPSRDGFRHNMVHALSQLPRNMAADLQKNSSQVIKNRQQGLDQSSIFLQQRSPPKFHKVVAEDEESGRVRLPQLRASTKMLPMPQTEISRNTKVAIKGPS